MVGDTLTAKIQNLHLDTVCERCCGHGSGQGSVCHYRAYSLAKEITSR